MKYFIITEFYQQSVIYLGNKNTALSYYSNYLYQLINYSKKFSHELNIGLTICVFQYLNSLYLYVLYEDFFLNYLSLFFTFIDFGNSPTATIPIAFKAVK